LSILDRLLPDFPEDQKAERYQLLGLMGMFFLVVTAFGILKPVRNAFALAGLGGRDFYKVYLVSAVVVLFVPIYNRLADLMGWRRLVQVVAVFFALNLLLFRLVYVEGNTVLAVTFYGWYDLFAAALVTQFFVATHMFLNARSAKSAYPLVIGGGAIGAAAGGLISGFLADEIGASNLLVVASAFIMAFALGIRWVWPREAEAEAAEERRRRIRRRDSLSVSEVRRVFSNHHVQLIAVSVLLIILAKQLVDYEYNTLTEELFHTQDAITAFQGKVNLAIQWLPLLSVIALRPLLRRWGLGSIVFILPVLILLTSLVMSVVLTIWTVIAVRTADSAFRYSAERAGREILYVPVPPEIKLKAKTYIDVGVEKGMGKALAAGFLALLVEVIGLSNAHIAWVVVGLALAWLAVTVRIRREYVRTLARSIRGRFASFQGLSALSDASTQEVVRRALQGPDPVQTSFALDLVDQSAGTDTRPIADALHDLLDHDSEEIRRKTLAILTEDPDSIDWDRVRLRLEDPSPAVREQTVRALAAASPGRRADLIAELLTSDRAVVRTAALACLARGEIEADSGDLLGSSYIEEAWARAQAGDRGARMELAVATGALPSHPRSGEILDALLGDSDPEVASAALRSAGLLNRPDLHTAMIEGLRRSATREAAREALAGQGARAVEKLAATLLDETAHPAIRRHIPSVLARVPDARAVEVMLHSVVASETDQLLDYRTLKALSKLRERDPSLDFENDQVMSSIRREVEAGRRYEQARRCLNRVGAEGPYASLFRKSLGEAWAERQEGVFRLLGLLYSPEEMYRCFLAIRTGDRSTRANAIEWLEETVDRALFEELAPVLGEIRLPAESPSPSQSIQPLLQDGDPWIARLAIATAAEVGEPWSRNALNDIIETSDREEFRDLARRMLGRGRHRGGDEPMDLIEQVFLLQKIDLLRDARSAHLALLASIAEEVDVRPDTVLIRQGEPTNAMYVVIDGLVELEGVGNQRLEASEGQAFGTWALIDEAPSLVTATVLAPSRLLQITRNDFYDLLSDHSELALGLLQGLARRVRTLVA
jgi:AAA family ATP:ADP antiporter